MLDTTFDEIWSSIVVPMSNNLYNRIQGSCNAEIFVRNLPQDKEIIRTMYMTTRDTLKQLYHYNNSDMVRTIDIHKVGACFASVIMEYKIFRYEINEQTSDEVFLSNAQLAYSVSLAIIKENLIYKYRDKKNEKILNFLTTNKLYMPKTTKGHDKFSLGRAKTLMLNSIFLEDFDILSYSDMLYWIELFNIMILEDNKAINYIEETEQDDD